ncbi:MAG: Kelch repeat-containing protein [Nitrospiria bacterium]
MKKENWIVRPPLHTARSHPATAVYRDKIYLFGGGGPGFKSLNSVEVFDLKTNQWSFRTEMPTLRSGAMAATVNEKIYVMGGGFKKPDGRFQFYNICEIYNPDLDSWEKGPDLLQPHDYPGCAILNSEIYILGGHHPNATEGGPQSDPGFHFCEKLNLKTERWEEIAPLNYPRFALSGGALGNKIVAFGGVAFSSKGFSEYDVIESYDPVNNQWTTEKSFALPWPAAAQGGITFNESIYLFGGYNPEGIHPHAAYYPSGSKEWELLPPMNEPRAAFTPVVINNEVFLAGGWAKDGRSVLNSVSSLKLTNY